MGWLRTWRINRAAKQYGRRLPQQLREGWGFSETYTAGQIKSAVKKLGLDGNFIALGYATFLPEEQFDSLRAEMPIPLSYVEARMTFARHLDRGNGPWEPAGENPYVMSGVESHGASGGAGSD